jgi:hypothetical protein
MNRQPCDDSAARVTYNLPMSMSVTSRVLSAVCFSTLMALPAVFGAGEFRLYPRSDEVNNPRVPAVPPTDQGGVGLAMGVETDFVYEFAPYVDLAGAGHAELLVRDNPRRDGKNVISLRGDTLEVTLRIAPAGAGRALQLVLSHGGKMVKTVALGETWGAKWKPVRLVWGDGRITVAVAGVDVGATDLPAGFAPSRVALESWLVDELKLSGRGEFSLGWENGYAADVVPDPSGEVAVVRLMGFDTYAVEDRPAARDFPMIQFLNGTVGKREAALAFTLRGEVSGTNFSWTQPVTADASSTVMDAIKFPEVLPSDVYHLRVKANGLGREFEEERHFFVARRRNEPAGPGKFGLHDSGNRVFGSWPDALGIDFAHTYSYWGYVVGPAWVKDFNGGFGIDPETPPAEWAWSPKLDWIIGQGLTPYVSLQSEPFLDWMRDRKYPKQKLRKYYWGERGGFPKLDLYRQFVHAMAERYKGRVLHYEVENEPNAGGSDGIPPEDYVPIAQAVYEEVKAVDPTAQVYGICGTGNFVPWMKTVFASGGAQWMDGVSIHTYVTPQLPEQANLPGKLAEVRSLIKKSGRDLSLINSETGTYIAPREQVDRPISDERLKELIEARTPTITVVAGWPNYALTEREGSLSIVRNAIYNFLGGAERFVFFGWNPKWPDLDWMKESQRNSGGGGFALISATADGVRTPGRQTLAVGVLTTQLEGAIVKGGRAIDENGVLGGVFSKQNGGEVAVLWSSLGKRSILLETTDAELEIVSLFGQSRVSSSPVGADGKCLHSVVLDEEPVYVHTKRPGIAIQPSPVISVRQVNRDDGGVQVEFTLINRSDKPWNDRVELVSEHGWMFKPGTQDIKLPVSGRASYVFAAQPPQQADRQMRTAEGRLRLPDGTPFSFPIGLVAKPVVKLAVLPDQVSRSAFEQLATPGGRLRLDKPEQVMVGRSPQLTSIQEEQYWKGPAELSAEVKIGSNARGLYVYLDVTDVQPHLPENWPGVAGAAVELFFDFRKAGSGFGTAFGRGAYQVVLKPALENGGEVAIWNASSAKGELKGTEAQGGVTPRGYWVMFHIPWESIGRQPGDTSPFGFDAAIDGATPAGGGRKSQMMLFGTGANNQNTSGYGLVIKAR